jgi:non-ribosomal peptide synthetase component E (peptide arylation enzyme)
MPRTQVGKLDKNKLRSQLVDGADAVRI